MTPTRTTSVTGRQIAAARTLLGIGQAELASRSAISVPTLKRMEARAGMAAGLVNNVDAVRRALEAAGVEFTNGAQPGVRMKSFKLKDAGQNAFVMDTVSKWFGFGAIDAGRRIKVLVEDLALERIYNRPIGGGTGYIYVLERYRPWIFKIAAEKYELGLIESGDVISVTDADVAQHLR
jgi:transcriptional regulator with XRE-family HTH domain